MCNANNDINLANKIYFDITPRVTEVYTNPINASKVKNQTCYLVSLWDDELIEIETSLLNHENDKFICKYYYENNIFQIQEKNEEPIEISFDLKNNNSSKLKLPSTHTSSKITENGNERITFKCDVCGNEYNKNSKLKEHLELKHCLPQVFRQHKCEFCTKSFHRVGDLNRHKSCHNKEKNNLYECKICKKFYQRYTYLQIHINKYHSSNELLKCKRCTREFETVNKLRNHVKYKHNSKSHLCTSCSRTFHTSTTLKIHARIHTGEKPYQCQFCLASFNRTQHVKEHIIRHHGKPVFNNTQEVNEITNPVIENTSYNNQLTEEISKDNVIVDNTNTNYNNIVPATNVQYSTNLIQYNNEKTENNYYKCEFCHKEFYYKISLQEHIKNHLNSHTNVEMLYNCADCSKIFKSIIHFEEHKLWFTCRLCQNDIRCCKKGYANHTQNVHKRHACSTCSATYLNRKDKLRHEKGCSLGITYTCNVCDKIFSRSDTLSTHIKNIHQDNFIYYKCNICDKKLRNRQTLQRHHIEIHAARERFSCNMCKKTFTRRRYVRDHMKTHEIQKFPCDQCRRKFKSIAAAQKHRDTFHRTRQYTTNRTETIEELLLQNEI